MAGQWQKDFFLITEDPFAVDLNVFKYWLEGYAVKEATEQRWIALQRHSPGGLRTSSDNSHDAVASPSLPSTATPANTGNNITMKGGVAQFRELLRQDCAQQYEAFEFLEGALADPVHFLEFCPVQLSHEARRVFVSGYYSLDSVVVREVLRCQGAMQIKLHGGGDHKAQSQVGHIARSSGGKLEKVLRILSNLQRACRWVEHAATQQRDMQALPQELKALGEPLCWRYRSLAFVLLSRFDLWNRETKSLRSEQIEDVAAVLLASGSTFEWSEPRVRWLEVLAPHREPTPPEETDGEAGGRGWSRETNEGRQVGEGLRELERKILRPRMYDFKTLLVQELERNMDTFVNTSLYQRTTSRGGSLFAAARTPKVKATWLDPVLGALSAGVASVHSSRDFSNFFGTLADFVERLRQLDLVHPLELFQHCYVAMDELGASERERALPRASLWPVWLHAWRQFLELYRACAACVLLSQGPLVAVSQGPAATPQEAELSLGPAQSASLPGTGVRGSNLGVGRLSPPASTAGVTL